MKSLLLLVLLLPTLAHAVGSVTVTKNNVSYGVNRNVQIIDINFVADAAAGTVPNTDVVINGYVVKVVTNPGSTAPTANYDIAFGDPTDTTVDLFAAALQNRHTTNTEQVYPMVAGAPGTVSSRTPFGAGTYQFQLTNNSVNSATGLVRLYVTGTP